MQDWPELLSQIENLIVLGRHSECRTQLNSLNPKHIPREWARQFAQSAARIQHSIFALKILHPYIRPENSFAEPATDKEKIVYANVLIKLGATDEALNILLELDPNHEPEALFFQSLACFSQWNYSDGVPLLRSFVAREDVAPYRRTVGQVNLIAALIYLRQWQESRELLAALKAICMENDYKLLLGNCYELEAQIHFFNAEYEKALALLEDGQKILKDQDGFYSLYIQKWILFCHCFQDPSPQQFSKINELRLKSVEYSHWETIRECDLFESILTQNENLFRKVILGTPNESYRQRARTLYGKPVKATGQFKLLLDSSPFIPLSSKTTAPPVIFDPYAPQANKSALYKTPQLLTTFEALMSDFYKPAYIGALFKHIYPEEKFNPYSSPARVVQLLRRLNQWFQDASLPLNVKFKKSEFQIIASSPALVCIQRGKKLTSDEGHLAEIKSLFSGRSFTSAKLSEQMGISVSSAHKIIKYALKKGAIISVGRGRNTIYRFATRRKTKNAA